MTVGCVLATFKKTELSFRKLRRQTVMRNIKKTFRAPYYLKSVLCSRTISLPPMMDMSSSSSSKGTSCERGNKPKEELRNWPSLTKCSGFLCYLKSIAAWSSKSRAFWNCKWLLLEKIILKTTSSHNLLWTYKQQGSTQIAEKFRPLLNCSLRILGINRLCCRFIYGTYFRDSWFVGIFLALSKNKSRANF